MAAAKDVPLQTQQPNFNHPLSYTASENKDVSDEDTTRGQAALHRWEAVELVKTERARVPQHSPAGLTALFKGLFADLASGQWNLGINELRYVTILLEHHIESFTFDRSISQCRVRLSWQIVKALVNAVVTDTGPGSLRNIICPWDVHLADINFDTDVEKDWETNQLVYCFRIVHYFYSINVDADRLIHDVFQYKIMSDTNGLALFPSRCPNYFAICLRDVHASFCSSIQENIRRHAYIQVLRSRFTGDSDECWSANALYVFTAGMRKHLPDARLYEQGTRRFKEMVALWKEEGMLFVDEAELYIPHSLFDTIAKSMQLQVSTQLHTLSDISEADGGKNAYAVWAVTTHGTNFVQAVQHYAPSNLIVLQGVAIEKKGEKAKIHRALDEIARYIFNTRAKMVKNRSLDKGSDHLSRLGGFRAKVAATSTVEHK